MKKVNIQSQKESVKKLAMFFEKFVIQYENLHSIMKNYIIFLE